MMKKLLALLLTIVCLVTIALSAAGCAEQKMPSFSINEAGELICTLPDGSTQNLGKVRGQDGEDGQDGRDGLDGKDGQNGLNGKDGINGQDGKDGEDGQNGKDGEDGSVITIGDNGHWYIDGEDTFIIAGERDAIEVDMTGEAFGPEIPLPVQFRNVPQTDHELNMENVNIDYDEKGEIDGLSLHTADARDVYALYDKICRDFDPDMNGLLFLPDTSGLTCIKTEYAFTQYLNRQDNYYRKILTQYRLYGYILINNKTYPFFITFHPVAINEEQSVKNNLMIPGYEDTFVRYICADGDKIITQPSQLMLVGDIWRVSGSDFGDWVRPDITSCGGGIYYPKTEGNPYTEDMPKLAAAVSHEDEYYFLNVVFQFYDELSMSDEEVYNAVRSIMEVLKDSFVVYDYDHYQHQFDEEPVP